MTAPRSAGAVGSRLRCGPPAASGFKRNCSAIVWHSKRGRHVGKVAVRRRVPPNPAICRSKTAWSRSALLRTDSIRPGLATDFSDRAVFRRAQYCAGFRPVRLSHSSRAKCGIIRTGTRNAGCVGPAVLIIGGNPGGFCT